MSEIKKNAESTAMTTVSGFAALTESNILTEALADDCQGLEFSFDRIKIPAGGSLAFETIGVDGEPEMVKDIKGVIIYSHPAFAYYRTKYQGGSNPPDCGSFDGITGIGNPGGECRKCPYNQFGSGEGKGKACKNRRMLYILQEGELFPVMLSLPVGSVAGFTNYLKHLLSKQHLRANQVVTQISLRKASNSDGITFSQAVFKTDRILSADEQAAVSTVTERVKVYTSDLTSTALIPMDEEVPFVDVATGEVIEPLR